MLPECNLVIFTYAIALCLQLPLQRGATWVKGLPRSCQPYQQAEMQCQHILSHPQDSCSVSACLQFSLQRVATCVSGACQAAA
jgi:hypothetical protein